MAPEGALALLRVVTALTPLLILGFLTCFLVWMGKGRRDNGFTRFCERAMAPFGIGAIVLVLATLRWF